MKNWSFYNKATGIFTGRRYSAPDDSQLEANTLGNEAPLEGDHDPQRVRVDLASGEPIEYRPPAPSPDHIWFEPGRAWVLSPAALQARTARAKIEHLEGRQARAVRELALNPDNKTAREVLTTLEAEIELERVKMQGGKL